MYVYIYIYIYTYIYIHIHIYIYICAYVWGVPESWGYPSSCMVYFTKTSQQKIDDFRETRMTWETSTRMIIMHQDHQDMAMDIYGSIPPFVHEQ